MERLGLVVLCLFVCLTFFECNVEDKAEETTTKSFDFEYEFDPFAINSVGLVCIPLPAIETFLSTEDIWNDIKDHIKEINVKSVQYKIPTNATPVDGKVEIYGGANEGSVSTDPWGETNTILANTAYTDYQDASLTGYGKSRLEEYANERDMNMVICGKFSPESIEANLTIQIKLKVEVKVSAL